MTITGPRRLSRIVLTFDPLPERTVGFGAAATLIAVTSFCSLSHASTVVTERAYAELLDDTAGRELLRVLQQAA